jgi:hypothetical protein
MILDDMPIPPTEDYFSAGLETGKHHASSGAQPMVVEALGALYMTFLAVTPVPAQYSETWMLGYYKGYTEAQGLSVQDVAH